jgi:hypothetical protein
MNIMHDNKDKTEFSVFMNFCSLKSWLYQLQMIHSVLFCIVNFAYKLFFTSIIHEEDDVNSFNPDKLFIILISVEPVV